MKPSRASPLAAGGFLAISGSHWLVQASLPSSSCSYKILHIYICVQISLFNKDINHTGLGAPSTAV